MSKFKDLPVAPKRGKVKKKSITLFPHHIKVIETIARDKHLSFSEAVQVIVDWCDVFFEEKKRAAGEGEEEGERIPVLAP